MCRPWRISVFGDEIADALEDQIAAVRAAGLDHLEMRKVWGVSIADIDRAQWRRASSLLHDSGVRVSAIASPVGKVPWNDYGTEDADRLRRYLEVAAELGAQLVRVFSYYVHGEYARARNTVIRRISMMAAEAERHGVTLVLENENYLFGDTPSRCRDILTTVDSAALKFVFDPANFVQCGVDPIAEAWPALAQFVAHVHVKDAVKVNRAGVGPYPIEVPYDRLMQAVRPAGRGMAGIPDLLARLDTCQYDGFLTIEPHLTHALNHLSPNERFLLALAALRGLLDPTGNEAHRDRVASDRPSTDIPS